MKAMNNEKIYFQLPAKAEYLSVLRLTTSSIASKLNFDIDTIEDLKMAISEASNISLESSESGTIDVEYLITEGELEVIIKKSETKNPSDEHLMMSEMIIEALMENVEFSRDYIKIKLYK